MACFSPLTGYRPVNKGPDGSLKLTFKRTEGYADREVKVACGQCIGCRLERSRQWAVRCVHEASLYENNCFITLTYDNVHLPEGNGLVYRDFELFMKRLRKRCGDGIRFYMCGEYGDLFGRPHYHACIFNYDFQDRVLFRRNDNGDSLFNSERLEDLWRLGMCTVGNVTFESAAYVARYVTKKMTTPVGVHPKYISSDASGRVFTKRPEFTVMSRKPGIGRPWLDKFQTDVYPSDFLVVNGKKMRPPRFYDGVYELLAPDEMAQLKATRVRNSRRHAENNTPERLRVREYIQMTQLERLKRSIEQ